MRKPRGAILPDRSFFRRNTQEVAKDLLGHLLYIEKGGHRVGGRIVETEAYLFHDDPACHASRGPTERNRSMFESGGVAYVYLIYGVHYCLNIVTGPEGEGTAVLIRSIEPLEGIEVMRSNRPGIRRVEDLANGPGKLTMALGITRDDDGTDLIKGHIRVFLDQKFRDRKPEITSSKRVGINQAAEKLLRYYLTGHPCVSRR